MHGRYGCNHNLTRNLIGPTYTSELLEQIDSPDAAIAVMDKAAQLCSDPITLYNLANLIKSGRTIMDPDNYQS